MKMGWFGVAVAPFELGFGPSESKWYQDLKKTWFWGPWGHLGVKSGYFWVSGVTSQFPGPVGPIGPYTTIKFVALL